MNPNEHAAAPICDTVIPCSLVVKQDDEVCLSFYEIIVKTSAWLGDQIQYTFNKTVLVVS